MDDVDKSLVSQNGGFVLIYRHFHLPFKQGVRSSNLRWVTIVTLGEHFRFLWSANCSFWFVPLRINKKPPWCDNRHGGFLSDFV